MQRITIEIPDNKLRFILEFLKNLNFVKIKDQEKPDKKHDFVDGTREVLKQVEQLLKSKTKLKSTEQLLEEF
jgi:hypothetical protein